MFGQGGTHTVSEHRIDNLDLHGSGCDCVSRLFDPPKHKNAFSRM